MCKLHLNIITLFLYLQVFLLFCLFTFCYFKNTYNLYNTCIEKLFATSFFLVLQNWLHSNLWNQIQIWLFLIIIEAMCCTTSIEIVKWSGHYWIICLDCKITCESCTYSIGHCLYSCLCFIILIWSASIALQKSCQKSQWHLYPFFVVLYLFTVENPIPVLLTWCLTWGW